MRSYCRQNELAEQVVFSMQQTYNVTLSIEIAVTLVSSYFTSTTETSTSTSTTPTVR